MVLTNSAMKKVTIVPMSHPTTLNACKKRVAKMDISGDRSHQKGFGSA
jgi:hypothetical protein